MAGTADDATSWRPQQQLGGHYRVLESMQNSSTLQLFRLLDTSRDEPVLALRPRPKLLQREGAVEWFDYLARQMVGVPEHQNVLPCRRLEHDGGITFLVMPDVKGSDCARAIADEELTQLENLLYVARGAAAGLAWLHGHGWVHYNVKPANILLGRKGAVKLFKYGLTGARTRAYASPEQMMSQETLSPATDIWSWAATVLEMFTGGITWPLGVVAPDALARYREEGPTRIDIPPMPHELADLLDECFYKAVDARPDAAQVVRRLEDISPAGG